MASFSSRIKSAFVYGLLLSSPSFHNCAAQNSNLTISCLGTIWQKADTSQFSSIVPYHDICVLPSLDENAFQYWYCNNADQDDKKSSLKKNVEIFLRRVQAYITNNPLIRNNPLYLLATAVLNEDHEKAALIRKKTKCSSDNLLEIVKQETSYYPSFVNTLLPSILHECYPGRHSEISPVFGSRYGELVSVFEKLEHFPSFEGRFTHFSEERNEIMKKLGSEELKTQANQIAYQMFLDYIRKYKKYGINEKNIVDFQQCPLGQSCTQKERRYSPFPSYRRSLFLTGHMHAIICLPPNDREPDDSKIEYPPYIIAIHELMHIEESSLEEDERFAAKTRGLTQWGLETLTTLGDLLRLDEIYKRCKLLHLTALINYDYDVEFKDIKIPLGIFVNYFRYLTMHYGSIAKAFLSKEFATFTQTGKRTYL